MDELPLSLLLTIVAILILLSAFFSSTETSMMSLNRYRLKHLRDNGHKGARRAINLLKRPDRLISLILIGNNLVNFVAASIFTVIVIRLWGEAASVVIGPIILTLVFLVFAEITPKTIAAYHPEKIAFPASAILVPLQFILFPVVWLINNVTNGLLRLIGVNTKNQLNDQFSIDELRVIVGEAGPHIPQRHQGMLLNILDLEHTTVEDIMIPRNEIVGIDLDDTDEQILEQLRSYEATRIPVYQEDINNIIGILHQRNITRAIDENGNFDRKKFSSLMTEVYFTHEITSLNTQLFNFQKRKRRMAVVVDEYGVVQGLVTLEDILEEIVGKFTSNITEETEDIHKTADGTLIIDGTATIREINKSLDWELPVDGPKTLNGLLLEHLESFPDTPVSVRVNNYCFEVIEVVDNVIKTAKAFENKITVVNED